MSPESEFDEKEFWIALFSIVARREEAREKGVDMRALQIGAGGDWFDDGQILGRSDR